MRVLGIDPGLRNMGWGVIEVSGSRLSHIANGICHSVGDDLGARLLSLHMQLTDVIHTHQAMLVPAQAGLAIGEYAPNAVKKAVVGVGHAEKHQVLHMVKLQLPGVRLGWFAGQW